MTPERWQKIESIFQAAVDLGRGDERSAFLDRECAGDDELRREVEKLILQYEESGDFIEEPMIDRSGMHDLAALIDDDRDPMLGKVLGVYRIEREIGRGGMGAVYEATRIDGEFRHRVAIKLVKRGMDTDFILHRFRNERQILAALDHPHIAHLMGGGTTDDDRPYFVMEYIEGQPLYQHCDLNRLDIRDRLRLFLRVCDAVHYAHQKKVLHRDLKPTNILVSAGGVPKLLDFGIAKLLDPEAGADSAPQTATAMRLMTVEYASPEQVQGLPLTFLSDVYSLGVILYELLTGHRPYRFRSRMPHDMARAIIEDIPDLPSTAVGRTEPSLPVSYVDQEAITISHLAEMRHETIDGLRRELSGNLDNIVLYALQKNPELRYPTAAALRDDILAYVRGEPVSAPAALRHPRRTQASESAASQRKSLAVLPLRVLNPALDSDTDSNFLSFGMADAVITKLSGIRGLAVRPTSAVLRYGSAVDPLAAGRELGVSFILDGRIRLVANRMRVSLQLLEVATGSSIWAGQFDEELKDALELEDSVSAHVAEALLPQLTDTDRMRLRKRGTKNSEAFEACLRGRYFWNQFTPESLQKALQCFEQAIALDPQYALPYVGLADFYNWISVIGIMPTSEALPKAKAAALRALELDEDLGEAYAALSFTTIGFDHDWRTAESLVRRALELNPNYPHSHECESYLFTTTGRFSEGIAAIRRCEELDPMSPRSVLMSAWTLYQSRHIDESIAKAEKALEMEERFAQGLLHWGNAVEQTGRSAEAAKALQRAADEMPGSNMAEYMLCFALAGAGRMDEAERVRNLLVERSEGQYVKPYFRAMAHLATGEVDEAFAWFERSLEENDEWMIWFGTDPKLDPLRSDPRYHDLLRRTKNPIAFRSAADTDPITVDGSRSIAVLPFKMFSANPANESGDDYLGVGLADSLISRFSNVRQFVVRPTSSVLRFGDDSDSFAAGRELGVDFVVDGSIRRVGERVRVTIQLLCVTENATRWARSFDEDVADVLALEDSISEQVTEALVPHLTGEDRERLSKRGTEDRRAYEAYLRGRFFWSKFQPDSFPKALTQFQTAIELDPNYAMAYVGIADFYNWACILGMMPASDSAPRAESALRRALDIDPLLGEAYAALGLVAANQFCWEEAEQLYQRSLELSPNHTHTYEWYSALCTGTGRHPEGLRLIRRTEELNPLSPRTMTMVSYTLYQNRDFASALAKAQEIVELAPDFAQGHLQMGNSLIHMGREDEAIAAIERGDKLIPDSGLALYLLCYAYAQVGRMDDARAIAVRMEELAAKRYIKPYFIGMVHAFAGDLDKAYPYIEQSFAECEPWLIWWGTDPKLERMRSDPRFVRLFIATNNPVALRPEAPRPIEPAPATGERTIAVLPLTLMNQLAGDTGDDYLRIGLADALITRLSNVGRFMVRPTSSILPFATRGLDSFEAGRLLGVEFVVDGNIRRIGDRIRVTVQLLSMRDNSTRWSQVFDENVADVLELEDSMSEKVAKSLLPHLSDEESQRLKKRGTDNPEAFENYLRGRHHWNTFTERGFAQALLHFNRAISIAPDYALAYAGIADYHNWLGMYAVLPFAETSAAAKEAAHKAIESDPDLADAQSAMAFAVMTHDFDWAEAERRHLLALTLNPKYAIGHTWYGHYLTVSGRFEEAAKHCNRGVELDPLTPIVQHGLGWSNFYARRYDESLRHARRLVANEPQYGMGYLFLCVPLSNLGMHDEALIMGKRAVEMLGRTPYTLVWLAAACGAAGKVDEANGLMAEIASFEGKRYISPYLTAMAWARLGNRDRALELLEKAWEIRDARLLWLGVDPQFDSLRAEPRLMEVLRASNNPLAERSPLSTGGAGI
jgi:TolB-like protein/Tfp pilus assembly protein PilF/tRNA A-37 threonylcarbamoyl transferase component Bud32